LATTFSHREAFYRTFDRKEERKMMRNTHLAAASTAGLAVVCCLFMLQSSFAGSIVDWGGNEYGEATPPDGNDFVAIAAGYNHSLAIKRSCEYVLAGDLNDDCKVDFSDFEVLAANWLIDCNLNPSNPSCVPK
jgi:hypothetical protein